MAQSHIDKIINNLVQSQIMEVVQRGIPDYEREVIKRLY